MTHFELPEELVRRFQAVSFERLEKIDASWVALTHDDASPEVEAQIHRELHTLKGEARVVGFPDVATLCQKLEDVLAAARQRRYRVHEDVDIVVTMAIQFIGMLLRKRAGTARGIDLEGFLRQIEEVVSEWLRRSSEAPGRGIIPTPHRISVDAGGSRMSADARHRLAAAATEVYLEHLRVASPRSRERLRKAWLTIAGELRSAAAVPLAPMVSRHVAAALELAQDIGRLVDVVTDVGDAGVGPEVLDAASTALLHALRNAIDHGIEPADVRRTRGKPEIGSIRVSADLEGDDVVLFVRDDGAGIDRAAVRARAEALGIVARGAALSPAEIDELVFHRGLSTCGEVTDLSGRGVGMDAIRAALDAIGGDIALESAPGLGTTVRVRVPQSRATLAVHAFQSPTHDVWFAVDAGFRAGVTRERVHDAVDPCVLLDLERPHARSAERLTFERDGARVHLAACAGSLGRRTATRRCRTASDFRVEIVELEGEEAILLRPEAFGD